MINDIKSHKTYYSLLIAVLAICTYLVIFFAHNVQVQILIVAVASFFYAIWGILHHYIMHDIHVKIVVEYVLIGLLGVTLTAFFLM